MDGVSALDIPIGEPQKFDLSILRDGKVSANMTSNIALRARKSPARDGRKRREQTQP
jgi:hypothetical protein